MPMPHWWGHVNKKLFNPRALENGRWDVVAHVGRASGKTYRTPIDTVESDGTFLFMLVYGSQSDWVQNIRASGRATLETNGEVIELADPRIIDWKRAGPLVPARFKTPRRLLRINEFLQMSTVDPQSLARGA